MAKPNYPKTQQERVEVYLRIMEEIKTRLQIIDVAKRSILPFGQARELCVLQLRHIAELIAIGCLAAQGKLTASNAILNEDNPKKILRQLDQTWKHAFPQSATIIRQSGGWSITANTKPNALARAELETMWAKFGPLPSSPDNKEVFYSRSPGRNVLDIYRQPSVEDPGLASRACRGNPRSGAIAGRVALRRQ